MKSLGFRNFRKFENLEPLELGGVTFLVGENNSGKSTFTKGALLLGNFLKMIKLNDVNEKHPLKKEFSFTSPKFRHVYIDTFHQALCNQAQNGVISFEANIDEFLITVNVVEQSAFSEENGACGAYITVSEYRGRPLPHIQFDGFPELEENVSADNKSQLDNNTAVVSSIILYDQKRGLRFDIDYQLSKLDVIFYDVELKKKHDQLVADFNNGNFAEGSHDELLSEITKVEKACVLKIISGQFAVTKDSKLDFRKASPTEKEIINESFVRIESIIKEYNFEYIYAHSVHQKSTYSYDASIKNDDFISQTISRYYNQEMRHRINLVESEKSPKAFVRQWMDFLNIGEDFEIKGETSLTVASDDRKLTVTMFDGDDEYNLSTKGIGFIQLFTLLLRLATIVTSNERLKTVVIEEPEQNLHPAIQSKLADLFYNIYQETDCQIIVETHSEYIVRKSQVIVSNLSEGEENPFKVYYFPSKRKPYELRYAPDGSFLDRFGTGFYDEAAQLHRQILSK